MEVGFTTVDSVQAGAEYKAINSHMRVWWVWGDEAR
jgi:hypothetical protein